MHRLRFASRAAVLSAIIGLAVVAIAPVSSSAAGTSASQLLGPDWVTYHASNSRTGVGQRVPSVRRISKAWTRHLDGAVYGQPLVIGQLVIAATEADSVYALSRSTGAVVWQRSLGTPAVRAELPCGNIFPLGITGTPAYNPSTKSLFAVAETTGGVHTLFSLALATGAVVWQRNLDTATGRDRIAQQQRGALTVANGRVYVPFGGLAGDCGNYVGYLTATPISGVGPIATYMVPTSRMGGIWAASGISVAGDGTVYAAVGNGASTGAPFDGSDSVLRLSADLSRRIDYFAPATWGAQNAADQDLGSTGPVLIPGSRALVSGKDGRVYLLNAGNLGQIGHPVASLQGCAGFGGLAYDQARHLAFVPCDNGLLAVAVGTTTLRAAWQATTTVQGSPVVGGGAVWTLDRAKKLLFALAESSGHELAHIAVGPVSKFATPVVTGSAVFVGTMSGVSAERIN